MRQIGCALLNSSQSTFAANLHLHHPSPSLYRPVDSMSPSPSPISYLPSELLSEIFRLCSLSVDQTDADMDGENSCMTVNPFGLNFTFRLSTVCHKWRNIIYNQANLWSNICITQNLLCSSQLKTKQISSCLERSRKHPLNLLIDARDPDWNWTEDGCVPLIVFCLSTSR